ncbi:hypothetical protein OV203_37610 [Nannocystis sp. ILAH1]|uniref:hypothetical protein n=1 Tax=unclassified Nannocystis TaxID=2627009 RepID=UPI00226ED7DC|nr:MULTISPECIES: hypothetical protein [unclassified Nannocystis]MCY0992919.1 hypothetical protein [Nannocystis sp. ILAH1]MCY1066245.1 hypothetical protein [Nannocystis sp. RBIL2]
MLLTSWLEVACESETNSSAGHVELLFQQEGQELCAGSVAHLDRFVERAFEFFDVPVLDDFRVLIRIVANPPCPGSACYRPAEKAVYIKDGAGGGRPAAVLRHELGHAVIDRLWGRSVPFFEEGLAEALSRTPSLLEVPEPTVPVAGMLDGGPAEVDYTAAARFVRFLVDTRGLSKFEQLFRAGEVRSMDEILGHIHSIYGETFASLEAEYLSGSPRCQYQLDICDPMAAETVEGSWSVSLAASCRDPDFYGSDAGDAALFAAQRTVEIVDGGVYRLRIELELVLSPGGQPTVSQMILTRCGGCDVQFVKFFRGADVEVVLEPGLYTFELLPAGDSVMKLELEVVHGSGVP